MSEKTNRLTIGLIRPELTDFADIVKAEAEPFEIPGLGTFYTQPSRPRPPSWITDFFGSSLDSDLRLITSTAKGVLLVRVPDGDGERIFAVLFGHGRFLLEEGVLEERFGLKVVLNSIDHDSLRSIDKIALGSVPKQSREQISRESGATSFGIDIEQDLVKAVTGRSRFAEFGKLISGRDSFATSTKFDVTNVAELLQFALAQYKSDSYQERFDWIDHIADVRTKDTIAQLDKVLLEKLRNRELEQIWMAPPDVINWADVKGFRYLKRRFPDVPDLDPAQFLDAAGRADLTLDWLKSAKILLISAASDDVAEEWFAYRCIYAEIVLGDALYILNVGKWYKVAADFTQIVNDDFASTPDSSVKLLDYAHDNEGAYNRAAATALAGSFCMDNDPILHGGGQSRIEFCDILTADKRLLHVKRYSGSAQLSHLFAQGVVSAELFVGDEEFRRKLNDKLPAGNKLANPAARPSPEDYEVVFAIISKSLNPLNLPFFSKVSLRNARRRLRGYGFRVSKLKVGTVGDVA